MLFLNASELESYLQTEHPMRLDVRVAESVVAEGWVSLGRWASAAIERSGYRVIATKHGGSEPSYGWLGPGTRYVDLAIEWRNPAIASTPSPSPGWLACRVRLGTFCEAMAMFTGPGSIGQPFGPEQGLEVATHLARSHFVDSGEVRIADTIVVMDILEATGDTIGPDDLDKVMGVVGQEDRLSDGARGLAAAASVFLSQFDEDGMELWELWKRRDDVATEFLCWHTVARLRLANVGKMSPL